MLPIAPTVSLPAVHGRTHDGGHSPTCRRRPRPLADRAAYASCLTHTGRPTRFTNPVTGLPRPNRVLRPFNKPAKNWLPGHRGVDLEAAPTDPIYAAGDGTVIYAGTLAGIPTVSIEHPGGLRTTYQPVLPLVAVGDTVTGKQPIGTLAPGGTHGYPGLQWGAKFGADDYINPLTLLPTPVIRLKPPPNA